MTTGYDGVLRRVSEHCGARVTDTPLRVQLRQQHQQKGEGENFKQSSSRAATLDAPGGKLSEEKSVKYGSVCKENTESHPFQAIFTADAQSQKPCFVLGNPDHFRGKFGSISVCLGPPRGQVAHPILSLRSGPVILSRHPI